MGIHWWLRLGGAPLAGLGGWRLGLLVGEVLDAPGFLPWGLAALLVGIALGLLATPYIVIASLAWAGNGISRIAFSTLVSGTLGLVVGLIIAALLSVTISRLSGWPGTAIPISLSVLLGALGMALAVARERDLSALLPERSRRGSQSGRTYSDGRVLMDTSAIIDGRIADISKTGFVRGTMVIPSFVLDELRHIADSSDALRRNRGRRGLEMLNKLRKESEVPIQILDVDVKNGTEVDGKLVTLAKSMRAQILTTDFNLNRVAELQGVKVLNVNELANALKPVMLPGEEMTVRVIQEGKEVGQGVGFLDDGTMV
ncbi:MAG: PIN domain nuclease, partial [Chloroflexi bacterium]|nr:PIN domain nuclease [Chloroflexota bacterium]